VEKRIKEVNCFVKVYLFVKELFFPSRKPRKLEIDWIPMKLDAEIQPLPTSKSNEKTMVDMGENG
tara:strand:+ start:341 stop:535 length:195 start_codon:yes stop_codon:yes gene_type:complete